jgi:hypothetical protein
MIVRDDIWNRMKVSNASNQLEDCRTCTIHLGDSCEFQGAVTSI